MRFRITLLVVFLLAAGCGDSSDDGTEPTATTPTTAGSTTTTEATATDPPWGLDTMAMPDTAAAVEAVLGALPDEVTGMTRHDAPGRFEGAYSVEYGDACSIGATPLTAISTNLGRDISAVEWLEMMSGGMEGTVESVTLEAGAPLAWIASAEEVDGETRYLAVWAVPDGAWYFDVVADSPEVRLAMVQSFIAAAA